MKGERKAKQELFTMLDAIKRDHRDYFGMGKMKAVKKLSNGAVVRVSITMPKLPAERVPAQIQAWEDIKSGKYTCPGCPIH